jgi:hypothetical protein
MRSAANILQEHGGSEADPIVAAYDYPDESGQVLFQKVRTAAKRFWQRRPNGNGNWINDTKGVRKLIYQLPQVVEAIGNDEIVVVVEDEKDARGAELRCGGRNMRFSARSTERSH